MPSPRCVVETAVPRGYTEDERRARCREASLSRLQGLEDQIARILWYIDIARADLGDDNLESAIYRMSHVPNMAIAAAKIARMSHDELVGATGGRVAYHWEEIKLEGEEYGSLVHRS